MPKSTRMIAAVLVQRLHTATAAATPAAAAAAGGRRQQQQQKPESGRCLHISA
jgi:hypothetical protein